MYRIEHIGPHRLPRIISQDGLSIDEFRALARDLGADIKQAWKITRVAARQATRTEHVETRWNGKETEGEAFPGDWIVTALAADGTPLKDGDGHLNVYVIKADRFASLYELLPGTLDPPNGAIFRACGTVEAIRVTGGFEIKAPWGEMQRADDGWLLLSDSQVYGNHHDTFAETYQVLD
ncbi:MAG: hypothetical protein AB7E81_23640 [Hyphomicrobiaceae bacterium]